MYILKPKEIYYKFKLPLLILFGDTHFSKNNQCICDNNECKNVQNTFLELINNVKIKNRNDKNISFTYDLYVEKKNKNSDSNIEFQDIYTDFLTDLRRNFCFSKKKFCKYNNINWHYVDIRFFKNRFIKDDKTKNDIDIILPKIFNDLKDNKNISNNKQFFDFINNINYINKCFYVYILYINNISLKNINYDEIINLLDNFKYDKNTSYVLLPNYNLYKNNDIYTYIFYYLDNYNIYKQLLKIDNNLKKNLIIFIIKYIKKNQKRYHDNKYYYNNIKYITKIINITQKINYIDNNNDLIINKLNKIINKIDYQYLDNFFSNIISFNTILLDIYYILRNLKISYDKNNNKYKSILSIGYFGTNHTIKLYNFFKNNFYDILYKNSYNDFINDIRCIKIDKNINLDDVLNNLYNEYNNNIDIKTKYEE